MPRAAGKRARLSRTANSPALQDAARVADAARRWRKLAYENVGAIGQTMARNQAAAAPAHHGRREKMTAAELSAALAASA